MMVDSVFLKTLLFLLGLEEKGYAIGDGYGVGDGRDGGCRDGGDGDADYSDGGGDDVSDGDTEVRLW